MGGDEEAEGGGEAGTGEEGEEAGAGAETRTGTGGEVIGADEADPFREDTLPSRIETDPMDPNMGRG